MDNNTIITIAGLPGSGKSSTADAVAQKLHFSRFSSGGFMRHIAEERGISIEEINERALTDPSIDMKIDEEIRRAGKEGSIVMDSRIAYHWFPDSFKVFLQLDLETSAQRIFQDIKERGRHMQSSSSLEELIELTKKRYEHERRRYEMLYNIDVTDLSPFDLVIDTGNTSFEEVVTTIVSEYTKWKDKRERST